MKKLIEIINRDIPFGVWTLVMSCLVMWHLGTESPYADRARLGQLINWFFTQAEIPVQKYNNRWQVAYRTLNPPRPCISCWIASHKFMEARKRTLEMEAKVKKYNEQVAQGIYPTR